MVILIRVMWLKHNYDASISVIVTHSAAENARLFQTLKLVAILLAVQGTVSFYIVLVLNRSS